MKQIVVVLKREWLEGVLSQMLELRQGEAMASVVSRGEINILSMKVEGGKLVPGEQNEPEGRRAPGSQEQQGDESGAAESGSEDNNPDTAEEKAVAAGITPIYRDADGRFCKEALDADGIAEFYLESISDEKLADVADNIGIVRQTDNTREEIEGLIKAALGIGTE